MITQPTNIHELLHPSTSTETRQTDVKRKTSIMPDSICAKVMAVAGVLVMVGLCRLTRPSIHSDIEQDGSKQHQKLSIQWLDKHPQQMLSDWGFCWTG